MRNWLTDESWTPPIEWRPELEERVVDDRPESRGRKGVVKYVEIGGPHFADRDYWVTVEWEPMFGQEKLERHIASHWLYREDRTQGYHRRDANT